MDILQDACEAVSDAQKHVRQLREEVFIINGVALTHGGGGGQGGLGGGGDGFYLQASTACAS